jgi:phage terminase large subunit
LSILRIETARVFAPLLKPARYKGAWGGRGSAKSHFFAGLTIEESILHPGLRTVCIREVQKSLEQSVKRLIEDKIQQFGVGSMFRVLNTHIETPGGGIIIFQGMQNHTAESIKSLEGFDRSWFEEAQSASQRSLDLLRPTIRRPNSELWFSWNPDQPTDPVDKLLRGKDRHKDAIVVKANYRDNPWFPDVLRKEMEWDKRRDPEKYDHVWMGGYRKNSEARVFKNWRIGDEKEFDQRKVDRYYFGADWGFSIDPTVLICVYIVGRTLYIWREQYQIGCEIDRTPALFDKIEDGMARKWPITADSARPETISYMRRNGFPKMQPAIKGAGSVEEGVEFLKSYDIVVHPSCVHSIDELSHYSFKIDEKTGEVLPKLEDKKNHVIDAIRYAIEPLRSSKNKAGVW